MKSNVKRLRLSQIINFSPILFNILKINTTCQNNKLHHLFKIIFIVIVSRSLSTVNDSRRSYYETGRFFIDCDVINDNVNKSTG